jgi:hypothetical protein
MAFRANPRRQVILPYHRTRKVAVMTVRSEQELAALKTWVGGQ